MKNAEKVWGISNWEAFVIMMKRASFWAWFISSVVMPLALPIILALLVWFFTQGDSSKLWGTFIVGTGVFVFFGTDLLSNLTESFLTSKLERQCHKHVSTLRKTTRVRTGNRNLLIVAFLVYLLAAALFIDSLLLLLYKDRYEVVRASIFETIGQNDDNLCWVHLFMVVVSIFIAGFIKFSRLKALLNNKFM